MTVGTLALALGTVGVTMSTFALIWAAVLAGAASRQRQRLIEYRDALNDLIGSDALPTCPPHGRREDDPALSEILNRIGLEDGRSSHTAD